MQLLAHTVVSYLEEDILYIVEAGETDEVVKRVQNDY